MSTAVLEVQTKEERWKYQTEGTVLLPYVDGRVSAAFSDEFLFFLYSQCKKDKIVNTLFPGMSMNCSRFVSYLKDRTVLVGMVKPSHEVAGFAFLYEVEGVEGACKGSLGFAFFKKFWGTSAIKDIARLALSWWFTEAKFNILFGTTLLTNRLAIRFAHGLGFQNVGRVPMFFCQNGVLKDMFLMYLTPETFVQEMHEETSSGRRHRRD